MQNKYELDDAFKAVKLNEGFWGKLIERTRTETLPHMLQKCEEEGCIQNLKIAAGQSGAVYCGGSDRDSNLFKAIEGLVYCLSLVPDNVMADRLEALITLITQAQSSDGYFQSFMTSQKPNERYTDLQRSHELYCMGHLIEAAVAHFETTGKRGLLDVALKAADHVDATFGPGKLEIPPGHQEIEMALVRLYRVTGKRQYLELSKYFVELRGNPDMVKREYGGKLIIENDRTPGRNRPPEYRQDHLPAIEQREATGHAVRAGYLYAAMTDIAIEYDSDEYATAAGAIWDNVVSRKLYISGGVGTHQYHDEGYGDEYVLPNTGYCETCGGIAFLLFSHRMGLLTGHARYADVIERILYNHVLSSMDQSGCNTFYRNPLSCQKTRERPPWNNPACCPTNNVRLLPQFVRFMYATNKDCVYVDQYGGSCVELLLDGGNLQLVQETDYPWEGHIAITVSPEKSFSFSLFLRIPGWVDGKPVPSDLYTSPDRGGVTIAVNGEPIDSTVRCNGYCVVERVWHAGDHVVIDFAMPIQRVYAHSQVKANSGRVSLTRGPLLYCFEEMDLGSDPEDVPLLPDMKFLSESRPDMLGGVNVLVNADRTMQAIPFYLWNNREPGRMAVWVKER